MYLDLKPALEKTLMAAQTTRLCSRRCLLEDLLFRKFLEVEILKNLFFKGHFGQTNVLSFKKNGELQVLV
jgi:predicted restriction endonuclease